jgi:esterase
MSFEAQARHVIEFADEHDIDKFAIVGHSMGGRAAMKTAITYPDRVQAVMSLDAPACHLDNFPGYTDLTETIAKFFDELDIKDKTIGEIMTEIKNVCGKEEGFVERTKRNFRYSDKASRKVEWRPNTKYILENLKIMYNFEQNGTYEGPALMLVNDKSRRFHLEHFKKCFPQLTNKDVIFVPNTSHWIHLDQPEETIKHITDLLSRI